MRLLQFDDFKIGVLRDDLVVDFSPAIADLDRIHPTARMNHVIEHFETHRDALTMLAQSGPGIPLADVVLLAPLTRPRSIICMARNFIEDNPGRVPTPINAFPKPASALVGPGGTMVLPDVPATAFEGEGEIAVIIGREAKEVRREDAMQYVFGYTNFVDGSARGLLPDNNVFYQMKARDTFAPIGPYIVTADEIADPHRLRIRLWVNDRLTQDFNTDDIAHDIPRCIEWITAIHTLYPGDIIALGTDHRGLSALHDGDSISLEGDGLGRLTFQVKDPLQRTWDPHTRLERVQAGGGVTAKQLSGKYAV